MHDDDIDLIRLIGYVLTQDLYFPTAALRRVHWPFSLNIHTCIIILYNCITILSENICRYCWHSIHPPHYWLFISVYLIYNYRQLILYLPRMHLYSILHNYFYLLSHCNPLRTCSTLHWRGLWSPHWLNSPANLPPRGSTTCLLGHSRWQCCMGDQPSDHQKFNLQWLWGIQVCCCQKQARELNCFSPVADIRWACVQNTQSSTHYLPSLFKSMQWCTQQWPTTVLCLC